MVFVLLFILSSCGNSDADNSDQQSQAQSIVNNFGIMDNSDDSFYMVDTIDEFDYDSLANFNKNSGGYVIEIENVLYYSNGSDGNRLYKTELPSTDQERVGKFSSEFSLGSMQYYNNCIYYKNRTKLQTPIKTEYATVAYSNKIVYYSLDTEIETVLIDGEPIIDFVIADDSVYYTTYTKDENGALYRMSLSEKSSEKLTDFLYPMTIQESNGKLYLGFNEKLAVFDTKDNTVNYYPMPHYGYVVSGDTLYFQNFNDYCVYKMEYDSEKNTYDAENIQKISDVMVSSFCIYGDNLIVSAFDNKIYCINRATSEKTVMAVGDSLIITPAGISYKIDDSIKLCRFD